MSRILRSASLWPPIRPRSLDITGSTFDLLEAVGIARRTGLAGSIALLPLGVAIRDRIEAVVRRAFAERGFLSMSLPALQSRALWERSGRWDVYTSDGSMFQLQGRDGQSYCLTPTSEELAVATVATDLRSYRDLPLRLYQSAAKYRDELSPRGGFIRAREFEMADCYTFDTSIADMHRAVEDLNAACSQALANLGLPVVHAIPADGGDISNAPSTEHVVPADIGQSEYLECPHCGYRGDGMVISARFDSDETVGAPKSDWVKVIAFRCTVDGQDLVISVAIRGDLQASPRKVLGAIGAESIRLLDENEFRQVFHLDPHFLNPGVADQFGDRLLFDTSVIEMRNFVIADSESATGLRGDCDWNSGPLLAGILPDKGSNVHAAIAGLRCGRCGEDRLVAHQAVELGHVFELGTRYSAPMGLSYLDETGASATPQMACSGIGIGRCLQTLAHVGRDERGLRWPVNIAPAHVHVMAADEREAASRRVDDIAATLAAAGVDVLVDDREVTVGEKFRYAWALGIPHVLVVSDRRRTGGVEWTSRWAGRTVDVVEAELPGLLAEFVATKITATTTESGGTL